MEKFDVIIIGAGIAGLTTAYELSKTRRVLVLEQEDQPGYHSTGRSAAVYASAYCSENTAIYALLHTSWPFFKDPPKDFSPYPLYSDRGVMFVSHKDNVAELKSYYDQMKQRNPDAALVGRDVIKKKFPPFKDTYTEAAIYDPNVYDLDVTALQEGYLRAIRAEGSFLKTGFRATTIHRSEGKWVISNGAQAFEAPCLVNAAGAWVDKVATMAAVETINIQPLRRTAILIDGPDNEVSADWSMVVEFREEFFFKPDAGKIMACPANEDLSEPCDVQPEDLDIAYAVHYAEDTLDLSVNKIGHSWAGLRSFVEDRGPVIGFDPKAEGFFWLAGLGGFGIQTAPASGRLAAALITGEGIPQDMKDFGLEDSLISPARLKKD